MDSSPDLTIMLLGNTGVGKSASGNTILGWQAFESKSSFKSVTRRISEATENVFGKQISVIDTPGILGFKEDIKNWYRDLLRSSRPCLFLVVISVGRFTEEQEKAVRETISMLKTEKDGLEKSFLLFTNGERLKDRTVNDFIYEDDENDENSLPGIFEEFGKKYHLFSNDTEDKEQVRELLIRSGHLQTRDQQSHLPGASFGEFFRLQNMRVILIGLPGGGKSSSGNTILGADRFRPDCSFNAVSTETISESAEVEGRWVTVIDTPGFSDERLTPRQLYDKITEIFVKSSPGPHAFVIVVRIGRVSTADEKLFKLLQKLFGINANDYTMVLFTYGEELKGRSIHEYIEKNDCVSDLVSMCSGRTCVFENTKRGKRQQVREFLSKVDTMVEANGGKHCTSEMFRIAEGFIREAERTQDNQAAETNESPQDTAQRRMQPHRESLWKRIRNSFLALCCCRSRTDSDEEMQPLTSHHEGHMSL